MAAKASSAHFLNSTELKISPDLFCDGEGPYKNQYPIRPTCEIFNAMELLEFLSWTWSLCDAEYAQKKVHAVEIKNSWLDVIWSLSPCAREKKIVFSAGQSALHGSSAYAERHGNERTGKSIFFLFMKL